MKGVVGVADQTVEVRFEFRHVFTCGDGQAEIERRIESMRARFERELQLATKNDRVRLSAHRGITDPPIAVTARASHLPQFRQP